MLIDAHDPTSQEHVLTFMFADPQDANSLYFLDQQRKLLIVPRDPDAMYGPAGGYLAITRASEEFTVPTTLVCKSWRPYRGYA
jgi:hypothetical protein